MVDEGIRIGISRIGRLAGDLWRKISWLWLQVRLRLLAVLRLRLAVVLVLRGRRVGLGVREPLFLRVLSKGSISIFPMERIGQGTYIRFG